jgi:hypothetical protein
LAVPGAGNGSAGATLDQTKVPRSLGTFTLQHNYLVLFAYYLMDQGPKL